MIPRNGLQKAADQYRRVDEVLLWSREAVAKGYVASRFRGISEELFKLGRHQMNTFLEMASEQANAAALAADRAYVATGDPPAGLKPVNFLVRMMRHLTKARHTENLCRTCLRRLATGDDILFWRK